MVFVAFYLFSLRLVHYTGGFDQINVCDDSGYSCKTAQSDLQDISY